MTDTPAPAVPDPGLPPNLTDLASALAKVGRDVRDVVMRGRRGEDTAVVRHEGGDHVFGIDARADAAVIEGFERWIAPHWPGRLVMEGFNDELPVGDPAGPWRFIVDPIDGTRPLLAGKRSAWVVLGGGLRARTLEDLQVGAAVEVPTPRAALARVAWATPAECRAVDEPVAGGPARSVTLSPRPPGPLGHDFVTVVHFGPGSRGPIGAWADEVLAGLGVFDDLTPCTAGSLMDLTCGAEAALIDPRPLFDPAGMAAHPYDLAALVVIRAAGVVVESLSGGPLNAPLDTTTGVAFLAAADPGVAAELRARIARAGAPVCQPPPAGAWR